MKTASLINQQSSKTADAATTSKITFNPLQLKSEVEKAPLQIKQNPLQFLQPKQNPLNMSSKGAQTNGNNPLQLKQNKTGLPDNLKAGVEALSGYTMDDVKVHYNSDKPAQLQALAYAQGTDIHVAPEQEKHLPHEAWHVVQQKQGRVQPTIQLKESVPVNDNKVLENEANIMGERALQIKSKDQGDIDKYSPILTANSSTQHKKKFESFSPLNTNSKISMNNIIQCLTDEEIIAKYKEDIEKMNEIQKEVIHDILAIDGWKAFLGGHVVVVGDSLFNKWTASKPPGLKEHDLATERKQGILKGSLGSSHYPNEQSKQYEIRLPNFRGGNNWGTVLFGLRTDPNNPRNKQTWFQVEGHSGTLGESKARFFTDVLMHGKDFLKHKNYFMSSDVVNVGPFGTDRASEKTQSERVYNNIFI
jgi:hypothetical protein